MHDLSELLRLIGGAQREHLHTLELALAAGVTTEVEGTIETQGRTVTVIPRIFAVARHTAGGYANVIGPVTTHHLHLEADPADVRGQSDLDHPVAISALFQLVVTEGKDIMNRSMPMSVFDRAGVFIPSFPIVVPPNSGLSIKVTPLLAPGTATSVYITLDRILCEGGKVPSR